MGVEVAVGAVLAVALVVYTLTGGADFGGGALEVFARGPLAAEQRAAVVRAIAPIWEANHVWLIVVVVVLFVCFPVAFAGISTALHIPLTVMLLGIVARGSAFVFRQYDPDSEVARRRWGGVFAVASLATPFTMGAAFAAVASGAIRIEGGHVTTGFFAGWATPFAAGLGAFVVAQVTYLAATYLVNETDGDVRAAFRRQGLGWGVALGITAFAALALARGAAPQLFVGLTSQPWSSALQVATAVAAVGSLAALYLHRYRLTRALAVVQITLIVVGGLGALYPYVIVPDLTLEAAAAPDNVLEATLWILAVGAVLLVPAFAWMMWVFKRGVLLRR